MISKKKFTFKRPNFVEVLTKIQKQLMTFKVIFFSLKKID